MAISVIDRIIEEDKRMKNLPPEETGAAASPAQAGSADNDAVLQRYRDALSAGVSAAQSAAQSVTQSAGTQRTAPAASVPAASVPSASAQAQTAGETGAYTPARLRSYTAQDDLVNALYDAKRDVELQNLKSAYDENVGAYELERGRLPQIYGAQRNAAAAESERQRQNFNEYAAASGLNSGAGGQAELSRNNALLGTLGSINRAQADAEAELGMRLAQLQTGYRNDISAALSQNDYQRAAALLDEYRKQEESLVSTAKAQADEDYRAYTAAYNRAKDEASGAGSKLTGENSTYSQLQAAGATDEGTAYDMLTRAGFTDGEAKYLSKYYGGTWLRDAAGGSGGESGAGTGTGAFVQAADAAPSGGSGAVREPISDANLGRALSAIMTPYANGLKSDAELAADLEAIWPSLSAAQKEQVRNMLRTSYGIEIGGVS